ncbi:hypothetical protein M0802_007227 [Mischocyttarus mexicanus]|nr:hypothetical protein M0802_007227 [Mischocyttarus mexicanus]
MIYASPTPLLPQPFSHTISSLVAAAPAATMMVTKPRNIQQPTTLTPSYNHLPLPPSPLSHFLLPLYCYITIQLL